MLARSSYIAATRRNESASAPSSSRDRTVISTSGSPTANRSAARRNSLTTLPMVCTMIQHRRMSRTVPRTANAIIAFRLCVVIPQTKIAPPIAPIIAKLSSSFLMMDRSRNQFIAALSVLPWPSPSYFRRRPTSSASTCKRPSRNLCIPGTSWRASVERDSGASS